MAFVCAIDRKFPMSFAGPSITGRMPRLTEPRGTTASSATETPGTWTWAIRFITTQDRITTSTRGTMVAKAWMGNVWTVSGHSVRETPIRKLGNTRNTHERLRNQSETHIFKIKIKYLNYLARSSRRIVIYTE